MIEMDAVTVTDAAVESVRKIIEDRGMTQVKLAEMAGMTTPDISRFLKGSRAASLGTLAKIASALGVTVASLFGAASSVVTVPLLGTVSAGPGEDTPFDPIRYIPVPDKCHGADSAYIVSGWSMSGEHIIHGDYIFVRRNHQPPTGATVVAWLADRGNVVKRLEIKKGNHILHSANDKPDPLYPYTMTAEDRIFGQLITSQRNYEDKEKIESMTKPKKKK